MAQVVYARLDPTQLEIPFRTVGEVLSCYASDRAERTAIHDLDRDLSLDFATLRELTERCATYLAARGVTRGAHVAILSDECLEKLVLMLATWRVGAVACPFHTEIAPDHLRAILGAIGPALVLWHRDIDGPGLTGDSSCPALRFGDIRPERDPGDNLFARLPAGSGAFPEVTYGPGDIGCIFATSGTTGRPKCVIWDHLGLWLCGLSTIDFTGMTADDRVLEYRTFSWLSPQIVTMMPFLALGLGIYVARRFSRSRFFQWIADHDITIAAGVPTVINMLLSRPVPIRGSDLPSLRLMTSSSAPLAPDQWRRFEDTYGIPLLQFYGASEGGWLCGNRHDHRRVGTVGSPARHQDLVIVDAKGAPCPPGVEGEITIRGHQTAVATIEPDGVYSDRNAFRLTERTRMGDLAVMDADGFVTVTGRVKDLIIRGGVNIAPLEIDAVLMRHEDVREAAAFGIPDPIYGEEVACYAVRREGAMLDAAALLDHCARSLPPEKMPKQARFIDALPKSGRGKVKRDLLKERWRHDHGMSE